MKKYALILPVLLYLVIISCDGNSRSREAAPSLLAEQSPENKTAADKIDIPPDRKIIREGEISFETSDIKETKNLIMKAILELNGYLTKETVNDYTDRTEQILIIRVPSDKFDLLLARIAESAKRIDRKNISSLDVTEEYIDVEARVNAKKELEKRYLELLRKANSVEDILAIERETGKLREEIESVEGRLRYLKDRVTYSSLTVTYYQKTSSKFGFWSKFSQSLSNGWKSLLWFLIGIMTLWPFILIAAVIIFAALFYSRKKKRKL